MADVLAVHQVDDALADVVGVIADALQRPHRQAPQQSTNWSTSAQPGSRTCRARASDTRTGVTNMATLWILVSSLVPLPSFYGPSPTIARAGPTAAGMIANRGDPHSGRITERTLPGARSLCRNRRPGPSSRSSSLRWRMSLPSTRR